MGKDNTSHCELSTKIFFSVFPLYLSPTSFLCSSTATLLLTYTPPLYYSAPSRAVPHPQLLTSDPLMLATGHNVEANFVNNFCVLVGPNQVSGNEWSICWPSRILQYLSGCLREMPHIDIKHWISRTKISHTCNSECSNTNCTCMCV